MTLLATSRGAVLLGCASLVRACSGGSPAQPRPPVEHDFEPLTRLIQQTFDTLDFADSAALILLQEGQVVYEGEFGALTLDSEVPLASAAKLLTATTVLAVVDDGSLALDGRTDDYLPENFYRGPGGSGKEAITIRQLLSLVSGVPTTHPCIYQDSKTLLECSLDIGSRSLVANPGEAFVYGQAAFTVAGAAAEVADRRSWSQLFSARIAAPLGLTRTGYLGGKNPQLGDGAVSSVREYSRLLQMIEQGGVFEGRRILSGQLIEEMLRDQTGGASLLFTPRDPGLRYGLGLWRDRIGSGGRALMISSPGSLGVVPWIDFERGLVGVLAVPPHLKRTGALASSVLEEIREIIPPR